MREASFSPNWCRDAVWYQIFPERFCNGCPASNPTASEIDPRPPPDWTLTGWGRDWYARDPWERHRRGFYPSVYARRYGGDLLGVREKLDYLEELGVNAVYFNPLFQAPSLHKYDASTLHHIDPSFGPDKTGDVRLLDEARETEDPNSWIWTAADRFFIELVADMHRRGMRVIIDGVFNHTGRSFFAFRDLLEKGRASPYRDWYRITRWMRDGRFACRSWAGHRSLPEFARDENGLAEPVKRYVFDITRRWMDPDDDGDPSDGVDGWRLDVAYDLPHTFWRDWRRHVKGINPEAYITGEIVGDAAPWLQGDQFDAVMNYQWLYPVLAFFAPAPGASDAATLRKNLQDLIERYSLETFRGLQNLLSSHDIARFVSMLENSDGRILDWDEYFNCSRARYRRDFKTTRPTPRTVQAFRQAVLFQMTFPGAPMIYYGDETGMWGANDPDNRQPMWWADLAYEEERHTPRRTCRARPRGVDPDILAFFRKAVRLRREYRIFCRGDVHWIDTGHPRLLGFRRTDPDAEVAVLLNAGDEERAWPLAHQVRDLWTGEKAGPGSVPVRARGWRVLMRG